MSMRTGGETGEGCLLEVRSWFTAQRIRIFLLGVCESVSKTSRIPGHIAGVEDAA